MKPVPFRNWGFSLLELLVVIAIIAILASLLLTAISHAKATSQRARCAGNLRQFGTALNGYLSDKHVYPVWAGDTEDDDGPNWNMQLARSGFGMANPEPDFYKKGVWRCPEANPLGKAENSYGYNAFGVLPIGNLVTNYGLSGHRNDKQDEKPVPIHESEVISPSEMMVIGESDAFAFMRNKGYDFGQTYRRHKERVNVLFSDGHVESLTLKALFQDTNDSALMRWNRDHEPHRDKL